MKYLDSGNFEDFEKELMKNVDKRVSAILEQAQREADRLKGEVRQKLEELKRKRLNSALKELDEEFSEREREMIRDFDVKREELKRDFVDRVFSLVLSRLDYPLLFGCFKERVVRRYGEGSFYISCRLREKIPGIGCTGEEGVLFKFEGNGVTVVFDEKEIEEIVEEEVGRVLREVGFG